jgi:lysine 6-dehydrogenase
MTRKYLVVGAGEMGQAIAYDLLKFSGGRVTLFDRDSALLKKARRRLNGQRRVRAVVGDANDVKSMIALMRQNNVAIGAADYGLNLGLTRTTIEAGIHFCDLGGNNDVVASQFALNAEAAAKGVKVIPDTGIAPGAAGIVVMLGIDEFRTDFGIDPDYAKILCGGLPQKKVGPLDYARVFSVKGLLNECLMPTEILRDGKIEAVESMTGLEKHAFPSPFGKLEAVYTSGGSSTLTRTLQGRLKDLSYKTLRYPGHWEKMVALKRLGFFGEQPLEVGADKVTPRAVSESLLERNLPRGERDALILRVIVGRHDGPEYTYDLIDLLNETTGHSAMQRTTGYSAAIIAQMLADGRIAGSGVMHQELCVPPQRFVEEWQKRDINLAATVTRRG